LDVLFLTKKNKQKKFCYLPQSWHLKGPWPVRPPPVSLVPPMLVCQRSFRSSVYLLFCVVVEGGAEEAIRADGENDTVDEARDSAC
jgi:hypothetical protein